MLDKIKYNFKHKKILWLLLPLILCLISILILTSNAFTNPKVSPGVVTSVNISSCGEFALHDKSASINLTNSYPMTDNMGLKTTPYTFDVKNTCNGSSNFNVYLVIFSDNTIDESLVKYNLDTTNETKLVSEAVEKSPITSIKNEIESKTGKTVKKFYQIDSKSLTTNASQTFNLKMWLDKSVGNDMQGKTFSATVAVADSASANLILKSIAISNAKTNYYTGDLISKNDYKITATYSDGSTADVTNGTTFDKTTALTLTDTGYVVAYVENGVSKTVNQSITVVQKPKLYEAILANNGGSSAIAAKGTPNFATAATTDEGMYAAPDDYGTSYYFRGAVSNNWVKFAGIYWRIVRINGNNTVKLVYSGTTAPTEAQKVVMTGTGTQINGTYYAFNGSFDDNMYVGYKYESGNVHGVTTNSTAKTIIDSWYSNNLASQASKIADVVYCNDRSLSSGTGTGSTATDYGAYARLIKSRTPILTCPNKSDAFTVADTTHGNASLQYPVALLTADEIAMAGASGTNNSSFYLYTNQGYWSLSPFSFRNGGFAYEFLLESGGNLDYNSVYGTFGLRSSISLTSDSETTGSGTWNDPYLVS